MLKSVPEYRVKGLSRCVKQPSLTIGRLARAAGVNVQTIRYYQRRGLMPVPPRPPGGVRRYAPQAVARMRFIKRAQRLGFTLEEIGLLLELSDGKHCTQTRELAQAKLAVVEKKIADLAAVRRVLKALIRRCSAASPAAGCPIIEVLGSENGA